MWRKKKQYAEEFRRRVVDELMNGSMGYAELSRHYGLSGGLLSQWVKRYGVEASSENEEVDSRALKARVAELERMVGRLAMENDFLKKFAAFTKQRTNERSSIVTPRNWESPKPAGLLGSPGVAITTGKSQTQAKAIKTSGSKSS